MERDAQLCIPDILPVFSRSQPVLPYRAPYNMNAYMVRALESCTGLSKRSTSTIDQIAPFWFRLSPNTAIVSQQGVPINPWYLEKLPEGSFIYPGNRRAVE